MLTLLQNADLWLLRKLNMDWTHPALDRLLPTMTDFGAWAPIITALIVAALIFGSARLRLLCLAIGLGVALGDSVVSNSLKHLTGRLRPHEAINGIVSRKLPSWKPRVLAIFQAPVIKASLPAKPGTRGRSFPSSHAVNVSCVAMVCWLIYGRRTWWVALLALLVAWSRIYCGDHWPSDVLFAIPTGLLCGWVAVFLTECLWNKFGGKFFRHTHAVMTSLRRRRLTTGP